MSAQATRNRLMAFCAAALLAARAGAMEERRGVSTASFLRLGAGSRGLGLAGAYTALADEPTAIYWNPAGLARISRPQFSYSHADPFSFYRQEFMAAAYPSRRMRGTMALGLTLLTHDSIEAVNRLGDRTGESAAAHGIAPSLGYAAGFSAWGSRLSLGAAAKLVRETLQAHTANAFAADLGLMWEPARLPGLRAAAAVRHLGTRPRFINASERLPTELGLGAALTKPLGRHSLTGAVEAVLPYDGPGFGRFGLEYQARLSANLGLSLRSGYKTQTSAGYQAVEGLALGGGLRCGGWEGALAFQAGQALGDLYSFTLSYRLGDKAEPEAPRGLASRVESPPEAADAGPVAVSTEARSIGPRELRRMLDAGEPFELIDVRLPAEFSLRHLSGARNVPFNALNQASLPTDRPLVLYCSQQSCGLSREAALALARQGYPRVRVLEGGLEAAAREGIPTVQPAIVRRSSRKLPGSALQSSLAQERRPMVIDARPGLEFAAGHIPGARSVPLEGLEQALPGLPAGLDIVVYDRDPERSGRAAEIIERSGRPVYELEGGIALWVHEGRPVESSGP